MCIIYYGVVCRTEHYLKYALAQWFCVCTKIFKQQHVLEFLKVHVFFRHVDEISFQIISLPVMMKANDVLIQTEVVSVAQLVSAFGC